MFNLFLTRPRLAPLLVCFGLAAQTPPGAYSPIHRDPAGWAEPVLAASPSVPLKFKRVVRYNYQQQSFDPPYALTPIARSATRYTNAEDAVIARMSAVVTADYDWWLTFWDVKSRQELEARMQAADRDKMVAGWKNLYARNHIELRHKITYGKYVVFTYRVVSPEGKSDPAELPVVFKLEDGVWKTTNDLRSDMLVPISPWISGQSSMEETIK